MQISHIWKDENRKANKLVHLTGDSIIQFIEFGVLSIYTQ